SDASAASWLEGRGPTLTLHGALDDARGLGPALSPYRGSARLHRRPRAPLHQPRLARRLPWGSHHDPRAQRPAMVAGGRTLRDPSPYAPRPRPRRVRDWVHSPGRPKPRDAIERPSLDRRWRSVN